jgi:hypothetical protein
MPKQDTGLMDQTDYGRILGKSELFNSQGIVIRAVVRAPNSREEIFTSFGGAEIKVPVLEKEYSYEYQSGHILAEVTQCFTANRGSSLVLDDGL